MDLDDLYAGAKRALVRTKAYSFADPIQHHVPIATAGVYSIWYERELLYVGMAGERESFESLTVKATQGTTVGLRARLKHHRSGQRTSQFCLYFCDRFIVPLLTDDQRRVLERGDRTLLDKLVRRTVRRELTYRFVDVGDGRCAKDIEEDVLERGLFDRIPLLQA